ncbi:MAG TPA: DUF2249 domain-containing protein [Dehalococcoidia bacterium]|jgi:uncharacterized protein (DUF2249 family)|nr:DUF2249 domain-containing protein [Dehalococcoidia bacterium]
MPEPLVVDVRPDIAAGEEPFKKIMSAVGALAPEQSLVLINSFEPTPLYAVMQQRGFSHETVRTDDGAWQVTFSR